MAVDLTQSFMGKHVEKVVLAAAVLVFLGSATWFVVMRQPQGQALSDVARLVKEVEGRVDKPRLRDALDANELVSLGIDQPATTAAQFGAALNGLSAEWVAVAKMVEGQPGEKEVVIVQEEVRPPKQILAIEDVQTVWGRGVTSDEAEMTLAKLETKTGALSDIVWAGCVGRFDLTEQLLQYGLPRKYILDRSPVTVSKVELRRRERKPDGDWSEWTPVPAAAPAAVAEKLPALPADANDKRAVIAWGAALMKAQAEVRRMPFYRLLTVDPEGKTVESEAGSVEGVAQPDPAALQKAASETAAEETARDEKKPGAAKKETETTASPWDFTAIGEKPKKEGHKPEETAAPKRVYATVWANDATVQPGKTYQYQMRLAVLNPVWSLQEVKDEEARWALEFAGPWSEAGNEVTIPDIVQFYFVGTYGQRVNLALHRWIHGQWVIVPSAPTLLGAPVVFTKRLAIPVPGGKEQVTKEVDLSPQTLVVDVVKGFPYKPAGGNQSIPTNVLVYADARGAVRERIEWEDRVQEAEDRKRRTEGTPLPETTRKPAPRKPPPKKPPLKRPRPR